MRLDTFCAIGLAVIVSAHPAMAQARDPAPVPQTPGGEVVDVKVDAPKETLRGRLLSFDAAALTIEVREDGGGPAGRRVTIPIARLRRVVVVKRDPIWNGAVFGAVFLAVCAATWCQQGLDKPSTGGDVILAAGMGALVFGGIDAVWVDRQTIYEASAARPSPGGSARVSFKIRF